jgi:hypothetical protein
MILTKNIQDWVEATLSRIYFVMWDRFSVFYPDQNTNDTCMRVFGWIDREDSYKDFAVLEFIWDDKTRMVFLVSTSSSKYSKEIDLILAGDNKGHKDCERIERQFNIINMVRLSR